MPDNTQLKGKADRKRVAGKEYYEVNYVMRKFDITREQVLSVIKIVGNSRKDIEKYLVNKKGILPLR
jgi:hypothetical protein